MHHSFVIASAFLKASDARTVHRCTLADAPLGRGPLAVFRAARR
jgi:hypothetical protein